MTQHEAQQLARIQAKNTLAPVADTTFLLDLLRKERNARAGLTGLGSLLPEKMQMLPDTAQTLLHETWLTEISDTPLIPSMK